MITEQKPSLSIPISTALRIFWSCISSDSILNCPKKQRLVAQALAEQRIRLGPQAEGEEKLLRRMVGNVTEYMDAVGLSNRLDENDRALLAEHDGEQEAAPVMGGMQL